MYSQTETLSVVDTATQNLPRNPAGPQLEEIIIGEQQSSPASVFLVNTAVETILHFSPTRESGD